jgi:hypothetical protein
LFEHVFFKQGQSVNQSALFHENIYDALGTDIAAAGGFKIVAGKLWPAESVTIATQKLRNALNPEQPHKLCPEEVVQLKRLAREAGSMATVDFEAQQLGFEVTWTDPKDEGEQLRRQFVDGLAQLNRLAERITRADERVLRAVK